MAAILVTRLEISLVIGPCEEPSPCPSEEGAQHLPDFDWLQTVVPKGLERKVCTAESKTRETGSRAAGTRQEDGSARGGRSTDKGPGAHGGQQECDRERTTFPEQL